MTFCRRVVIGSALNYTTIPAGRGILFIYYCMTMARVMYCCCYQLLLLLNITLNFDHNFKHGRRARAFHNTKSLQEHSRYPLIYSIQRISAV